MNCPKCKGQTSKRKFSGIEIDRCTGCGGLWFDENELAILLKTPDSESIDAGAKVQNQSLNAIGNINCPKCNSDMVRMVDAKQPHVWFEKCGHCYGIWLDAGEFKDLKEHTVLEWFRDFKAVERN